MAKDKSLFGELTKIIKKGNERAFLMTEDNPYEVKNWVPTGCYGLNAVLSDGDIFKGLPDGKRIMVSGEQSTAKSAFTAYLIKSYIMSHEDAYAIFFETEGSSTVDMAKSVGIPEDRIIIIPVMTIEECRTQMVNLLDKIIDEKEGYVTSYTPKGEKKRKKLTKDQMKNREGSKQKFIFVIDSLGMLSTSKETGDVATGSDKRDMTRAQLLKGFARVTSLKFSLAQCPLIVVNHVYATMDQYNPFEVSGGSGGKYMSDIILGLFKNIEKDGSERVGVRIRVAIIKSRYANEKKQFNIIIHFKYGIYKFSGLIDMAEDLEVFSKEGYSFIMPDGTKARMKEVRTNPKKYLNETNLEAIRQAIHEDFKFGNLINDDLEMEFDDDNEIIDDVKESHEETEQSTE